jgi:hypothetical protein
MSIIDLNHSHVWSSSNNDFRHYILCSAANLNAIVSCMNKSSVKKKRPAKAARSSAVRKSPSRATAARKPVAKVAASRRARKPEARKPEARKPEARKLETAKTTTKTAIKSSAVQSAVAAISAIRAVSAAKALNGDAPELDAAPITVAQVTALVPTIHSHRFQVGQTVFYTSSPISRPGATGTYKVVRLLPSDGDDYQYRIKNPGEAFERVAKESQLEVES